MFNAIEEQERSRYQKILDREDAERFSQQKQAIVVGYDSGGNVLVSVDGSGSVRAMPLTNANLSVGTSVSFFRQASDSSGFVDAVGAV